MDNIERGSQYCVLWNNYHSFLSETVKFLQQDQQLIDVTLVTAEGKSINAHQLVLAACSTFFRNFIKENSSRHPIVLLPSEIKYAELKAMIEFMYTGQVCIQQDRLQAFVKGARYFKIKGLEDSSEGESEPEEFDMTDSLKDNEDKPSSGRVKRIKYEKDNYLETDEPEIVTRTTIKGKTMKDHRYTQNVELGDSDDNREKWEMVDRKPIIFPRSKKSLSGLRKKHRKLSCACKVPMHLSNNIVCYEQKNKMDDVSDGKEEPINKVRRPGYLHDICNCAARKIWSVKDTEALLNAWMDTLNQVPPSYFIRSMNLCRRVSKKLQQMGIHKTWRQCQVKMKNLRREVRLYKEQIGKSSKKTSAVADACEKLLTSIEEIFNKEESIRREWYEKKTEHLRDDGILDNGVDEPVDILGQADVLADSDMGDDDTDMPLMETEGEGGLTETEGHFTEGEEEIDAYVRSRGGPHYQVHTGPDGTVVHHIVEEHHGGSP